MIQTYSLLGELLLKFLRNQQWKNEQTEITRKVKFLNSFLSPIFHKYTINHFDIYIYICSLQVFIIEKNTHLNEIFVYFLLGSSNLYGLFYSHLLIYYFLYPNCTSLYWEDELWSCSFLLHDIFCFWVNLFFYWIFEFWFSI